MKFILIIILSVGLNSVWAEKLPILPEFNKANTQSFIKWSENCLVILKKSPVLANNYNTNLNKILNHLKQLPPIESSKNLTFHNDIQILQNHLNRGLHYKGIHLQNTKAPPAEFKELIASLNKNKAAIDFSLPFYFNSGNKETYYKNYRECLEILLKQPKRLTFIPKIPPHFSLDDSLSITTLDNIFAIYDLCKRHYWMPDLKTEETLLLKISSLFKNKKKYHFARNTLDLLSNDYNSQAINAEKSVLTELIKKEQKKSLSVDLY